MWHVLKIKEVRLRNFLSFGNKQTKIRLSGLTTIVGPNSAGKTSLLRAIEAVGNCMIRPQTLPKAYHHNGNIRQPIEIEIDVEFNDNEKELISDFLTCSFIAHFGPNNMQADLARQTTEWILQSNIGKRFGNLCGTMTAILRIEHRSLPPDVYLRIGKDNDSLFILDGNATKAINADIRTHYHVAQPIFNMAAPHITGLDDTTFYNNAYPSDLYEAAGDPLDAMIGCDNDVLFYLGQFSTDHFERMAEIPREFARIRDFVRNEQINTINFNTMIAHLFSKSIVKMSGVPTQIRDVPISEDVQNMPIENVTGHNLSRILFRMNNKDDPAIISRYNEIISKMKEMTGLDVRIQISARDAQNQEEQQPDYNISVNFMRDEMLIPAELVASGDIELLIFLTTLIGQKNRILLLDEPASSLHPDRQKAIQTLMHKIAEEGRNQIIIITHSPFLTDPYGREPLLRFFANETGTKVVDVEQILSENEKAGTTMQNVDVRSMMFQMGVIIVEGLSDKMVIESTDKIMTEMGDGPDIEGNEWAVLEGGGKYEACWLSYLAKEMGIPYIVIVDRDALMRCEKKISMEDKKVLASPVVRHIYNTYGFSDKEQRAMISVRPLVARERWKEYDPDDFDDLRDIARSHDIHVLNGDLEEIIGIKKRGRGKPVFALRQIDQMCAKGQIPEGLRDLMNMIGRIVKENGRGVAWVP